jgi:spermidine/putrescine transport system permease protein
VSKSLLNIKLFILLATVIAIPVVMIAVLSFYSNDGISQTFSIGGYKEIISSLRLNELLKIAIRALIVSSIATIISFLVTYILVYNTSKYFQSFFFILVTLPFLANESVRVFSWQYFLSENGLLNNMLSLISGFHVTLSSATNIVNVYIVMIITCIPFGVFISAVSFSTIPSIYSKVADDLNLNALHKFLKVVLPLSKIALIASMLVTYFISFSLSSEVNYLGGDSKICLRNFVLSLMSASKFESIFSLGFLITILIITIVYLLNVFYVKKLSTSK